MCVHPPKGSHLIASHINQTGGEDPEENPTRKHAFGTHALLVLSVVSTPGLQVEELTSEERGLEEEVGEEEEGRGQRAESRGNPHMARAKLHWPRGRWRPEGRMEMMEPSPDSAKRMHGFWWRGGILRLVCMLWLVTTVSGRLTMQSSSSTSSSRGSSDSRSSSPYPSTPSPKMESSTSFSTDSSELELRKTMPVFPGDISELRKDQPGLFEENEESTSEESPGKGEEDGKPRREGFFKDYNSQELSDLAGDILEACKPLVDEADEHEKKIMPELEAWARCGNPPPTHIPLSTLCSQFTSTSPLASLSFPSATPARVPCTCFLLSSVLSPLPLPTLLFPSPSLPLLNQTDIPRCPLKWPANRASDTCPVHVRIQRQGGVDRR